MDRKQAEWIWEYVLKHSSSHRVVRYLAEAFPIPDDNIRLKKMVLLRTLSHEVSKGSVTELCIEVLQGLAELSKSEAMASEINGADAALRNECLEGGSARLLERQEATARQLGQEGLKENEKQVLEKTGDGTEQGYREAEVGSCERAASAERAKVNALGFSLQNPLKCRIRSLRRELGLAIKVELTVRHLREDAKGWTAFLEALDKYWGDAVDSEEVGDQEDAINSARKQMKLELWALKARPKLQSEVISKYTRDSVEKMTKNFLDLAWEEIGPTFLEKVEEDVVKGMYRPAGSAKLLQCTGNRFHKKDLAVKEKVNQGKASMLTSIDVSGVGNARQDSLEVSVEVSHDMEGKRDTETFVRDGNIDEDKFYRLQNRVLHETVLHKEEVTRQECNNRIKTRSQTRCLQEPPLKKHKGNDATRTPDSIARKQSSEKYLAKARREKDTSADGQEEEPEAMVRLNHIGKYGSESKDEEASESLRKYMPIQENEAVQREELEQTAQVTVASDGLNCMNRRREEVIEDSKKQYSPTSMETNGDQLKNASGNLNADSPSKANYDSPQGNDVEVNQAKGDADEQEIVNHYVEQGTSISISKVTSAEQLADFPGHEESICLTPPWAGDSHQNFVGPGTKLGPRLMRGLTEKRRLFRRGAIDVECFIVSGTEKGLSGNPEVSKAQQELKNSQSHLQSWVKDPLPEAIEIAEEVSNFIEKSVRLSPGPVASKKTVHVQGKNAIAFVEGDQKLQQAQRRNDEIHILQPPHKDNSNTFSRPDTRNAAKASLMDRNASARTLEWENDDETEDDQAGSSPSDSKRVHLPKLRSTRISPLKQPASTANQAYRRRRRKWSKSEEDTLREGVARHGKGRWKLILQEHLDIFEDRTEVDLKDKWRNIEKSEGIHGDD
ncbi:hypothetical protein O6H91_09G082600 [Diphasiastrum complanatum]|uniref:Uncharacterized protein n=2 Tax=Diphasiastrum complanatum TaxID=34168 RepID=A0ACC2CRE0_DIPCM|nr:hypothetical protein O6H91_09G082600 [Diphasiastrum complanatum]